MPAYGPVMPLYLARQLAEVNATLLGNYHLLLARDILAQPEESRDFWTAFRQRRRDVDRFTIIVDNGAPEGDQVELEELHQAAVLVEADVVALPDTIGDMSTTLEESEAARAYFKDKAPWLQLMGVAQGDTPAETLECMAELSAMKLDWLSLPKGWSERLHEDRLWATLAAAKTYRHNMHVLGFTNNLEDDIATARAHWLVKGIDSAMPIWLGQQGILLKDQVEHDFGRRPRWSDLGRELRVEAVENIRLIHSWLGNETRSEHRPAVEPPGEPGLAGKAAASGPTE